MNPITIELPAYAMVVPLPNGKIEIADPMSILADANEAERTHVGAECFGALTKEYVSVVQRHATITPNEGKSDEDVLTRTVAYALVVKIAAWAESLGKDSSGTPMSTPKQASSSVPQAGAPSNSPRG